ncbi:MAG: 16S rRNA (guanine(966)-N(2))-methyltransferase RsmD [Lactobacillus sp.]
MRIIAGRYAKRNLFTLKSQRTRPTSDKIKESLFNALGQFFTGGSVLDLYAGSGALGIEAVSRGYDHAVLNDMNGAACEIIRKNLALTKEPDRFQLFHMRSELAIKHLSQLGLGFDLVFLDPPYVKQQITADIEKLSQLQLLNPHAMIIAETDHTTELAGVKQFDLIKKMTMGRTIVWFYREAEV